MLTLFAVSEDSGLSPALLSRARSMAAEHANLSKLLANAFNSKVAKRVAELEPVASALKEWETANEVGS
jgi:peptide chain release factor 1